MTERWTVETLDRDDHPTGRLKITGGHLEWNIDRQIRGSGSIEVANPPEGLDWLTTRLRITHWADEQRTPMGIWVPVWPEWHITGAQRTASISLLDRTSLLDREVPYMSQSEAGTIVIDRVRWIMEQRATSAIALTPSAEALRQPITWEARTTWLKVVNDLLSAIGYAAAWADGNGWLRAEPWRAPEDRPLVATYGGDPADYRVLPAYTDSANIADLPNRVVAYSKGDATREALRGDAELPLDHPLGYRRRGDIPRTYTDLEASSQAVIDAHAARLLAQATNVTRRITYTHPVDETQMGDRVRLRHLGVEGVVVNRKVKIGLGPVVEDTVRRVYKEGEQSWI